MRPHRRQPTRLHCPWDSAGKNTGVGCHFLLQCKKVKSESEVSQSSPTLSDPMGCRLPGSSIHGIFQARVLEWIAIAFSSSTLLCCFFFQSSKTFKLSQNCWSKNHDKTFCFPLHLPTQKTLWEKARVGCLERTASEHVYYQGWNRSPAQVGCMRQLLRAGALGRLRGIRWRGRWEGRSGGGEYM